MPISHLCKTLVLWSNPCRRKCDWLAIWVQDHQYDCGLTVFGFTSNCGASNSINAENEWLRRLRSRRIPHFLTLLWDASPADFRIPFAALGHRNQIKNEHTRNPVLYQANFAKQRATIMCQQLHIKWYSESLIITRVVPIHAHILHQFNVMDAKYVYSPSNSMNTFDVFLCIIWIEYCESLPVPAFNISIQHCDSCSKCVESLLAIFNILIQHFDSCGCFETVLAIFNILIQHCDSCSQCLKLCWPYSIFWNSVGYIQYFDSTFWFLYSMFGISAGYTYVQYFNSTFWVL